MTARKNYCLPFLLSFSDSALVDIVTDRRSKQSKSLQLQHIFVYFSKMFKRWFGLVGPPES